MAEANGVAAILDVFRVDPDTEAEERIGAVELSADGRLAVLEADAEHALKLESAVASVNGKPRIVELVPPPDATQAGQVASRVTERTDPQFRQALNRYLRTYYRFALG